MSFRDPLHAGQVEVLQWVADGCPADKWTGHSYKTTANALAGRRLLTVSKKGGVWSAQITPAGTHYLAHGDYPPDHWTARKKASSPASLVPSSPPGPRPSAPPPPQPRSPRPVAAPGDPKPTRKLVDDVLEANGILVREVTEDSPRYSHLVGIVNGRKLIPDDLLLLKELSGRCVEIRLASRSDWTTQKPREIADPSSGKKLHPAVRELRSEKDLVHVTPVDVRNRAFRLLNALAVEARARGIEVTAVKVDRRGYRQAFDGYHGHLLFAFDEVRCVVSVNQNTERVPHVPTRTEEARKARGGYIPDFDNVKTARLTIHANDDSRFGHREHWSDTKTLALEYRLHDVLASLFARNERETARIERERQEAIERRKREEIATARATEAYYEQRRIDALLEGFSRYTRKNELTAFVSEMERRAAGLDGEERTSAEEWIAWCRQYVAALDPFQRIAMPETKPPGYAEIAEFKKVLGYHVGY